MRRTSTALLAFALILLLVGEAVATRSLMQGPGGKGKGKGKANAPGQLKKTGGSRGKASAPGQLKKTGGSRGKASAPGRLKKTGGATTTGKATATGKGKGKSVKACTTVGCLSCNPGGKCKTCDVAASYGKQGNRCILCTGLNMTLDTKGKCKCAEGFDWNNSKTACVVDAPETR